MTVSSFPKQKRRTEHLALVEMYMADSMLSLGQITPTPPYDALGFVVRESLLIGG